jgi:hypothetical protein
VQPGTGYATIWSSGNKQTHYLPADEVDKIAKLITDLDARPDAGNVYTGVGLAACEGSERQRPKSAEVVGITSLWADIDIAGDGHAGTQSYPATLDDALRVAHAMRLPDGTPLPPTVIVHSGHGIQARWVFAEPWLIGDADDPTAEHREMQRLAKAWVDTVRVHAQRLGMWAVDPVGDLARLMRPAGTTNRKGTPVPVRIIEHDPDAVYNPGDLAEALLDPAEIASTSRSAEVGDKLVRATLAALGPTGLTAAWQRAQAFRPTGFVPDWLDELIELSTESGSDQLQRTWSGQRPEFDGDDSRYDLALASLVASVLGGDDAEKLGKIAEAVMARRLRIGRKIEKVDPSRRVDYIGRTIALAIRESGAKATASPRRRNAPSPSTEPSDSATPGDANEPWPEIQRLSRTPSPLPVDALGSILGPMVSALAESLQVPGDMVANLGLPVITTAARGEWTVRLSPDWSEPLILATVSAAESGERKSATIKAMTAPLEDFENDARNQLAPEIQLAQAEFELKAGRVKRTRQSANAATADKRAALEAEYFEAVAEANAVHVPVEPRWLADDATPERLVSLLAEQDGALGVFSAEGGFFASLGRYTDSPQLDGVLKATAGDAIRVDRQGRPSLQIRDPALSVGLCTQPGRLAELGRDEQFRASGLLARFAFVLPEPRVGFREVDTVPVPQAVAQRWREAVIQLAQVAFALRLERQEAVRANQPAPPRLEITLNADAAAELRTFRIEGECELRATGTLATARDWGSKSFGFAARIAAALTLLSDPTANSITGAVMADAIRLTKAYAEHVVAAFGAIAGRDDALAQAQEVADWLKAHGQPVVKLTELRTSLKNRTWAKGNAAQTIGGALVVLAEHGYVRMSETRTGGRPSPVVLVNPAVL